MLVVCLRKHFCSSPPGSEANGDAGDILNGVPRRSQKPLCVNINEQYFSLRPLILNKKQLKEIKLLLLKLKVHS